MSTSRALDVSDSMRDLLAVLHIVQEMCSEGKLMIVRCKNRFQSPTAAGWADAMLNMVCLDNTGDDSGGGALSNHVCEL